MPLREGVAGTIFQVSLEGLGPGVILKADHDDGFPGLMLLRVGRAAGVMLLETFLKV
jgi:hypothetical protein